MAINRVGKRLIETTSQSDKFGYKGAIELSDPAAGRY